MVPGLNGRSTTSASWVRISLTLVRLVLTDDAELPEDELATQVEYDMDEHGMSRRRAADSVSRVTTPQISIGLTL